MTGPLNTIFALDSFCHGYHFTARSLNVQGSLYPVDGHHCLVTKSCVCILYLLDQPPASCWRSF